MHNRINNKSCKMKLSTLILLLSELASEIGEDSEVWLSSDEEGNEFLPMSEDPDLSIAVDTSKKKIVFFPMHRGAL